MTPMLSTIVGMEDLPQATAGAVAGFVEAAQQAFGNDLRSVVLYGSAAEGRLRASSDINLLLMLSAFAREKAEAVRDQASLAGSAVRLRVMFLLESELAAAGEMFAQKFSDIIRRHRVLLGPDPFTGLSVPRSAVLWRLRQVLLNLTLRLRQAYVDYGTAPERITAAIADAAGPLRSCAATIAALEDKPAVHPKEALAAFAAALGEPGWDEVLSRVSKARERELLTPAVADATLFRLIDLAQRLRMRAESLR
jgi:predicted nucleotidyltransferase